MRIAVSGHRDLYGRTAELIATQLSETLTQLVPNGAGLTGISCIADGADSLFARAVLSHGGRLEVVVPAAEYRDDLPDEAKPEYDDLLVHASEVRQLDHVESNSQAHMDASVAMLDGADHLIAVWDGQPARGFGGTADVVAHAREHSIGVTVVWPNGAERGGS